MQSVLITGGAGFIGSAVVKEVLRTTNYTVINLDKLTYAGNLDSLKSIENHERYIFECVDICDKRELRRIFEQYKPRKIIHLAAETHVDRSIDSPEAFLQTNVMGAFCLLEASRFFYESIKNIEYRSDFRFIHVSTDEVFGDLEGQGTFFTEHSSYAPSSPYSASKAGSDHLARAWYKTFGLPTIVTNCSNNYGPFHFPEKLIPHIIINALHGKNLPIYGDGLQVRDWLYVEDHAKALVAVLDNAEPGETYTIGGSNEKTNLEVVEKICDLLEELAVEHKKSFSKYRDLIEFVDDRPGHDIRYAIDASKITRDLDWAPQESFETGLRKTVQWYLDNENWWSSVLSGSYNLSRQGGVD